MSDEITVDPALAIVHHLVCYDAWREGDMCPHELPCVCDVVQQSHSCFHSPACLSVRDAAQRDRRQSRPRP